MENLVNSSIQVMIWRLNKAISINELKKKAKMYKNKAGVHLNDVQFSVEESDSKSIVHSEFESEQDSMQSEEESSGDGKEQSSEQSKNIENHDHLSDSDNSHEDK